MESSTVRMALPELPDPLARRMKQLIDNMKDADEHNHRVFKDYQSLKLEIEHFLSSNKASGAYAEDYFPASLRSKLNAMFFTVEGDEAQTARNITTRNRLSKDYGITDKEMAATFGTRAVTSRKFLAALRTLRKNQKTWQDVTELVQQARKIRRAAQAQGSKEYHRVENTDEYVPHDGEHAVVLARVETAQIARKRDVQKTDVSKGHSQDDTNANSVATKDKEKAEFDTKDKLLDSVADDSIKAVKSKAQDDDEPSSLDDNDNDGPGSGDKDSNEDSIVAGEPKDLDERQNAVDKRSLSPPREQSQTKRVKLEPTKDKKGKKVTTESVQEKDDLAKITTAGPATVEPPTPTMATLAVAPLRPAPPPSNPPVADAPAVSASADYTPADFNVMPVHLTEWLGGAPHVSRELRELSQPRQWLNDASIKTLLNVICLAAPTKAFALDSYAAQAKDFHRGATWDIGSFGKIYLPLNISNMHWVLVVISPNEETITIYDSLYGSEISADTNAALDNMFQLRASHPNISTWQRFKRVAGACPKQPNGWDCGIYVVVFAMFIVSGSPIPPAIHGQTFRFILERLLCRPLGLQAASAVSVVRDDIVPHNPPVSDMPLKPPKSRFVDGGASIAALLKMHDDMKRKDDATAAELKAAYSDIAAAIPVASRALRGMLDHAVASMDWHKVYYLAETHLPRENEAIRQLAGLTNRDVDLERLCLDLIDKYKNILKDGKAGRLSAVETEEVVQLFAGGIRDCDDLAREMTNALAAL